MDEKFKNLIQHPYVQMAIPFLRKKYALAVLVFALWVTFIDSSNLFEQLDAMRNIRTLEATKEYYQEKVEKDSKMLNEIKTNDKVLERYAREHYFMKRDDEEIFILKPKE